MAGIESACFEALPELSIAMESRQVRLAWDALPGASAYQIYRSTQGCTSAWKRLTTVDSLFWQDQTVSAGRTYHYRIEAIAPGGICQSMPSPCVQARSPIPPRSHLVPFK
jgi:fibronectin type 3 domain-containing protein